MKKNFQVNIGGRLFNIDEDAYRRLDEYFARLKSGEQNIGFLISALSEDEI